MMKKGRLPELVFSRYVSVVVSNGNVGGFVWESRTVVIASSLMFDCVRCTWNLLSLSTGSDFTEWETCFYLFSSVKFCCCDVVKSWSKLGLPSSPSLGCMIQRHAAFTSPTVRPYSSTGRFAAKGWGLLLWSHQRDLQRFWVSKVILVSLHHLVAWGPCARFMWVGLHTNLLACFSQSFLRANNYV